MEMNEPLKIPVSWEDFCQVTRLSVEVLRDNQNLRDQIKQQGETIRDLIGQRQELYDKLVVAGVSMWPPKMEVPDGDE